MENRRKEKKKTHRRIKQPPRNAIKSPHIRSQTATKAKGDEQNPEDIRRRRGFRCDIGTRSAIGVEPGVGRRRRCVGHLRACEGEEQEEKRPDELAEGCYEVVAGCWGKGKHWEDVWILACGDRVVVVVVVVAVAVAAGLVFCGGGGGGWGNACPCGGEESTTAAEWELHFVFFLGAEGGDNLVGFGRETVRVDSVPPVVWFRATLCREEDGDGLGGEDCRSGGVWCEGCVMYGR